MFSENNKITKSDMDRNQKIILLTIIIALAAISRLIPHPFNFTPIGAIGLFGAAYFKPKWLAFLIPIAALWLSDIIIMNGPMAAFYEGFQWFGHTAVYLAFIIIIGIGFLLRGRVNVKSVIGASLGSSLLFFIITNAGVWLSSIVYPNTFSGLIACFTAAIPFFWSTLAGDLFYCGVMFGSYAWFTQYYAQRQAA